MLSPPNIYAFTLQYLCYYLPISMLSLSDSIFPAFRKIFSVIFIYTFSPSYLTFVKKCYTAHIIKITMDKKSCFKYKISIDIIVVWLFCCLVVLLSGCFVVWLFR